METVEIIVYLLIAIIIGVLIIFFINKIGNSDLFDNIKDSLIKNNKDFEKVTANKFSGLVYSTWKECGFGIMSLNKTVYVISDNFNEINKTFLFNNFKSVNLCNSIQSIEQDCGTREDVVMDDILLPAVVRIECNNQLIIS